METISCFFVCVLQVTLAYEKYTVVLCMCEGKVLMDMHYFYHSNSEKVSKYS